MKFSHVTRLTLGAVFFSVAGANTARAQQADLCRAQNVQQEIQLQFSNAPQTRVTFVVDDCTHNTYTAHQAKPDPDGTVLFLQFPAGDAPELEIALIRKTLGSDGLAPTVLGTWDRRTGEIKLRNDDSSILIDSDTSDDDDSSALDPLTYDWMAFQYLVWNNWMGNERVVSGQNMGMVNVAWNFSPEVAVCLKGMFSTDYWTTSKANGVPLPLQIGEGYTDAQHPHKLVAELVACVQTVIRGWRIELKAGPVGEVASGPPMFAHRFPEDPDATLNHHYMDATHISSNPITLKLTHGAWTYETSAFAGGSQNPLSLSIESHPIDSISARISRQFKSLTAGISFAAIRDSGHDALENEVDHQKLLAAWILYHKNLRYAALKQNVAVSSVRSPLENATFHSAISETYLEAGSKTALRGFGIGARFELLSRSWHQLTEGRTFPATVMFSPTPGAHYVSSATLFVDRKLNRWSATGVSFTLNNTGVFKSLYPQGANTFKLYARFFPRGSR